MSELKRFLHAEDCVMFGQIAAERDCDSAACRWVRIIGDTEWEKRVQLAADLGQNQAWDRYHALQDEVGNLYRLCAEVVGELGGPDRLPALSEDSWTYRLRAAASKAPLLAEEGT